MGETVVPRFRSLRRSARLQGPFSAAGNSRGRCDAVPGLLAPVS